MAPAARTPPRLREHSPQVEMGLLGRVCLCCGWRLPHRCYAAGSLPIHSESFGGTIAAKRDVKGGESLDEFSTRVRAGFEGVLIEVRRLQYRSIAAFLHEGVINVILDNLEGFTSYVSNRRIPMPNCAIITVDTNLKPPYFDGDWETLHLHELSS